VDPSLLILDAAFRELLIDRMLPTIFGDELASEYTDQVKKATILIVIDEYEHIWGIDIRIDSVKLLQGTVYVIGETIEDGVFSQPFSRILFDRLDFAEEPKCFPHHHSKVWSLSGTEFVL
jgi:hypothetical protein